MYLNCKGQLIDLSTPRVMGILNVTPDSFFDGNHYLSEKAIGLRIEQVIAEGANFIDIGAYSSRPGAAEVSPTEEWNRLQMGLSIISRNYPQAIISIDTFRAEIAQRAVEEYGAAIINDISGGELDPQMFATIAKLRVPYIVMHMQGNPENMQEKPTYNNVVNDIVQYFSIKTNKLKELGIADIIIDPGFGFGKTLEHNYTLLKNLNDFKMFNHPVLIGVSRKSMIYKPLNIIPNEALNGTTVINTIALMKGAHILRVHDVKQAVEAVKLVTLSM